MKPTRKLLLAAALLSLTSVCVAAESLCHATEDVLFNCTIRRTGKVVSVCSSPGLTKTSGYLQYRFGTRGQIELEFPSTRSNTQDAFTFESHHELGDYEALNFKNGTHGYTVQRWIRRSPLADSPDSAGVLVYPVPSAGGQQVIELKCSSQRVERPMNLANVVPEAK